MFFCQLFNDLMLVWSDYLEFSKTAKSTQKYTFKGMWMKRKFKTSQQFHQYRQNGQPPLTLTLNIKNTTPNDLWKSRSCPGTGIQLCGG